MQHGERVFDNFGDSDPRKMPGHLFGSDRHLDYSTAVRADISRQNFSVCPRHWYINAAFHCSRCGQPFVFTAEEQKFWYEELKFWIDSRPKECAKCRQELRAMKALQQEYDREIASALSKETSVDQKQRLVAVIEAIEAGGVTLAAKVVENRRVLLSQIQKSRRPGAA
jgi:Probable zinc-ribbon domain